MNLGNYILVGHEPVYEPDLVKWAMWFETADRQVRLTVTEFHSISTVFLGIDHSFQSGPPVLFETMVFGDDGEDVDTWRYHTWTEAEAGHELLVRETLAREVTPALSMLKRVLT